MSRQRLHATRAREDVLLAGPSLFLGRLGGLLMLAAAGCTTGTGEPGPDMGPREACRLSPAEGLVEVEGPLTLHVVGEAPAEGEQDPELDLLLDDLPAYLRRMTGEEPVINWVPSPDVPEAESPGIVLWTGEDISEDAPAVGYRLASFEGDPRVFVIANDVTDLAHGAYELLERMGARFFHPLDELVPEDIGPALPLGIEEVREPAFAVRGLHLHLLHPTEYLDPFLTPSPENLEVAKKVIDWHVKTGQNHIQWWIMRTVDWDAWLGHGQAIVDYAHQRGLTAGIAVQFLDDGSSLQNQYVLASSTEDIDAQVEAALDELMEANFDLVEVSLGEFFAGDPEVLLSALDHATAYLSDTYPGAELGIHNHIGNYPELYLEWEGEEMFYYHLPGEADPRLINTVHTVFFFDLYRDWAMYEHEDFSLQREFMFRELPERKVRYFPESAYWVSADVDVPVFLAEYLRGRWTDVHNLTEDVEELGLPAVEGHTLFSSGHEWNYWLVDYLTARMLWAPDEPLEDHLAHYSDGFAACAPEVQEAIVGYTDWNTKWLFDERLVPYVSGEDIHDDLGYAADIDTHPPRVSFGAVRAMNEAEREAFASGTVAKIEEAVAELDPLVIRVADRCAEAEGELVSWCGELVDGMEVTGVRLEHSAALYRALLAALAGDDYEAELAEVEELQQEAASIIERRQEHYRFDHEVLTAAYENPTRYKFGYLRQAHTLCLWERQEEQVRYLIDHGEPISPFELPTCQD